MTSCDSNVSIAENAQHDPHCAWFLTAVKTPLFLQSTDDGAFGDRDVYNSCLKLF